MGVGGLFFVCFLNFEGLCCFVVGLGGVGECGWCVGFFW